MNYSDYIEFRRERLAAQPDLVDAGETNLYRALVDLVLLRCEPPTETIHRCHLASQWVDFFGLPAEDSKCALVSSGVRDSLQLMFQEWASSETALWLPEDNYPVYAEMASRARLAARTFLTLPQPNFPTISRDAKQEVLLLTNPLKPLGRHLSEMEVAWLRGWLGVDPGRRVVMDAVYSLSPRFHHSTLALLQTDQAILLHSLTKGWLNPRLFGIALVPKQDLAQWKPVFQRAALPQQHLASAREFLAKSPSLPLEVARRIRDSQRILTKRLSPALSAAEGVPSLGYFVLHPEPFAALLERGVLGIPATVFGSRREDLTILSSLSFTQ